MSDFQLFTGYFRNDGIETLDHIYSSFFWRQSSCLGEVYMARLGSRFRYWLGPADTNPANAEQSLDYLILPGRGRNSLCCAPLSLGWDRNGLSTCTASSLHSVSLLLCESEISTPFWALLTPEGTKQDTDSITSFCLNSFAFRCEKKLSSPLSQSDTSKVPATRALLDSFHIFAAGLGWRPWTSLTPWGWGKQGAGQHHLALPHPLHCCHVRWSSAPHWAMSTSRGLASGAVTVPPYCSWDGGEVHLLSGPHRHHSSEGGRALTPHLATTRWGWKPSISTSHSDTAELGRFYFGD